MWRILVAAAILGTACGPSVDPVATPPGPGRPFVDREPPDLPRYPEEAAVGEAIAAAGFEVRQIAVSKFEDHIFAERKRARVFYSNFGKPFRVDVLFLDSPPGEVRICPVPGAANEYSIAIAGRPAFVGSTAEVFFAVSARFFVLTSEKAIRDALVVRLGLAVPPC